jgi:membrane-bound serine protease (ClpP class)
MLAWLCALLALSPVPAQEETAGPAESAARGPILLLEMRGPLVPVTEDFLARALQEAESRDARLVLVELDTPGGLVTVTRALVSDILESPVPVGVYVAPSGASAASGGVFLVLAADVAAMAPVSDLGAAHPVFVAGENEPDDIALEKAENELAAFARSLAEHRGRNPDGAEQMVRESRSYSAREALDEGFIDLIASDRAELLGWLDDRPVRRYDGSETRLSLAGIPVEPVTMNLKERVLAVLSQPLVAVFLLAVGMLGIYVEITNPGALLPAAVGVVCLLLFGLASQALPVNWLGVGLIGVGLGLLILEVKVISYGALTVGGLVCLVIGGLVLFEGPPELRVPTGLIVSVTLAIGVIAVFLVQLAVRAQISPPATGREALVGMAGEALTDLDPHGKVLVRGEYYDAQAEGVVRRGGPVVVLALEGRRLRVRAASDNERATT